jgi:hypothetical protein
MDSSSKRRSSRVPGSDSEDRTVAIGTLAAEALSAGPPRPERLDAVVAQAIRFYLRPESGEAGWAYPKFLDGAGGDGDGGRGEGVEVHVERSLWEELGSEARRQEVDEAELLQHAAMFYAAARDGGRLTTRILEVIDGDAATGSRRRHDRRSA